MEGIDPSRIAAFVAICQVLKLMLYPIEVYFYQRIFLFEVLGKKVVGSLPEKSLRIVLSSHFVSFLKNLNLILVH